MPVLKIYSDREGRHPFISHRQKLVDLLTTLILEISFFPFPLIPSFRFSFLVVILGQRAGIYTGLSASFPPHIVISCWYHNV